jgi:ABC-type transport system substrate-binding protein
VVVSSLEKIGIKVKARELASSAAYTTIQTVKNMIPLALNPGWGKDYPDAYSFAGVLFSTDAIIPTGNTNYPLVSLTPDKASELGIPYPSGVQIPNVTADIDTCQAKTDFDQRTTCFADLDKKLMEQAVAWIPILWNKVVYITNPSVTHYEFDQFSTEVSFTHVAVSNKETLS